MSASGENAGPLECLNLPYHAQDHIQGCRGKVKLAPLGRYCVPFQELSEPLLSLFFGRGANAQDLVLPGQGILPLIDGTEIFHGLAQVLEDDTGVADHETETIDQGFGQDDPGILYASLDMSPEGREGGDFPVEVLELSRGEFHTVVQIVKGFTDTERKANKADDT